MSISIGGVTFEPGGRTPDEPDKPTATKDTYAGAAYFSWPANIVGKEIEITKRFMPNATYAALRALYIADEEVVYDPGTGGATYNVNILFCNGDLKAGFEDRYRYKFIIRLQIMSVVVV